MYKWKFKDNIDMSILKNYGYEYDEDSELYVYRISDYEHIIIWEESRNIDYGTQCCEQWDFSELCDYDLGMVDDLYQDGLLERISVE